MHEDFPNFSIHDSEQVTEGSCLPLYVAFSRSSRSFNHAISSSSEGSSQNSTDPWLDFVRYCVLGSLPHCSVDLWAIGPNPLYQALWLGLLDQRLVCSLRETAFNVTLTSDGSVQNVVGMPSFEWLGTYNPSVMPGEWTLFTSFSQTLVNVLKGFIAQCSSSISRPAAGMTVSSTAVLSTGMSTVVSETVFRLKNISLINYSP